MNDVLVLAEVGGEGLETKDMWTWCLYFADYYNSNSISLWNVTQSASFPGLPNFCHSVGVAQIYIQEVEEGRAGEHFIM